MEYALLKYLDSFRPIPAGYRNELLAAFEARKFSEQDILFKGGRICTELFFVERGVLKIMRQNPQGKTVTHFFIGENQFCTILASFNQQLVAQESIVAACNTEVLCINRNALMKLYQEIPWLETMINQIFSDRLLKKVELRNSYLGLDSSARYQLFLQQQSDIATKVSLTDIASYLEITPQSLSRIRKQLH